MSERDEPDWDVRDLTRLLSEENPHDLKNYYLCPSGRHWGRFGAAGLLPWCRHRERLYVLLARRSAMVETGGCWSTLGGALNGSEPDWLAALRESHEEARIHVGFGNIHGSVLWVCPEKCGWGYVTHLARMDAERGLPDVHIRRSASWETTMLSWFAVDEVPGLDLHPGLASVWPEIAQRIARS